MGMVKWSMAMGKNVGEKMWVYKKMLEFCDKQTLTYMEKCDKCK